METTNQEILQLVRENQAAIKENQQSLKEVQQLAKENQVTLEDLIDSINTYATKTDSDIADLKTDVAGLKADMSKVRSDMVTKDYFDSKFAEWRGDSNVLMRKEDAKLGATIQTLAKRRAITVADKKHLLALEPFPQR